MAKRKTIKKKERQRMAQVITGRLEDSGRYNIVESEEGHILVAQKPELVEDPSEIYVVLHNRKVTVSDYKRLVAQNKSSGRYVSNVFYKDGINFLVRLAFRGKLKGDYRSLKKYSHKERSDMVHLRDLEKVVLDLQPSRENRLVFFQPETARLEEGLRGYDMKTVELDYSHVKKDHPGYGHVSDGPSKDYKLAEEVFYLRSGGAVFSGVDGKLMLVVSPQPVASPQEVQTLLFDESK